MSSLFDKSSYQINHINDKSSEYCLCIFVINEGDRIRRQLSRCAEITHAIDIVIADGGSSDGSLALQELGGFGVKSLLVLGKGKGLGTQMRMAFSYAIEQGYQGVVCMDGNNKDDPADALKFIAALDAGHDHVQGSRFIKGGIAENTPWSRYLGVRCLHAPLLSLASGFWYTDTTNGFRAYSLRLLLDERIALFREVFSGYELHYYLALKAARLKFNVVEVPVARRYPKTGKAPTKISPIRGNLNVLKKLFRVIRRYYDPNIQS